VWLAVGQSPTLRWSKPVVLGDYEVQIATDEEFKVVVVHENAVGTFFNPLHALARGSTVGASDRCVVKRRRSGPPIFSFVFDTS